MGFSPVNAAPTTDESSFLSVFGNPHRVGGDLGLLWLKCHGHSVLSAVETISFPSGGSAGKCSVTRRQRIVNDLRCAQLTCSKPEQKRLIYKPG